jgi:hypothetical protein
LPERVVWLDSVTLFLCKTGTLPAYALATADKLGSEIVSRSAFAGAAFSLSI